MSSSVPNIPSKFHSFQLSSFLFINLIMFHIFYFPKLITVPFSPLYTMNHLNKYDLPSVSSLSHHLFCFFPQDILLLILCILYNFLLFIPLFLPQFNSIPRGFIIDLHYPTVTSPPFFCFFFFWFPLAQRCQEWGLWAKLYEDKLIIYLYKNWPAKQFCLAH